MKKILVAIVLFSSMCQAQDTAVSVKKKHNGFINYLKDTTRKRNFFFSLNAGLGIPVLDYGSTDIYKSYVFYDTNRVVGMAVNGFHFNITAGALFIPQIGIVVKAGMDISSIDERIFSLANPTWHYSGGYKMWQLTGGLIFRFKIAKRSHVFIQPMIGIIQANYPTYTINNDSLQLFKASFVSSVNTAFNISGGFENELNPTISWYYTLGYTYSRIEYTSYSFTIPSGPMPLVMTFGSMQATVGFIFHL